MFYARHNNPLKLEKLFKVISDILTDVNFIISKKGISLKGMCSSHTSLLFCNIDINEFDEYNYKNTCEIEIGINLKSFYKLLSISENNDSLLFELKDNSENLKLIFDNKSRTTEFNLNLLNINTHDIQMLNIKYDICIDINLKRLNKLCQEISIVESDNLEFQINNDTKSIYIFSNGNIGSTKTTLKSKHTENPKLNFKINKINDEIITKKIENKADYIINDFNTQFKISFCIKNLEKIIKLCSIVSRVEINLNDKSPLKLKFSIKNNINLDYYIAPKYE